LLIYFHQAGLAGDDKVEKTKIKGSVRKKIRCSDRRGIAGRSRNQMIGSDRKNGE